MRQSRFPGWAAAGALVTVLVLGGCGGGGGSTSGSGAPRPTGANAHNATLLAGRTIFTAQCSSCHGVRGEGALGPALTGGRLLRDFPNPQDQVSFVSQGRGVMPAFSGILTRAQIESVVAYERTVLDPRP
jgi:mono/diheme cytochrome c family protein